MTTTGEVWTTIPDDDHTEPLGAVSTLEWPWDLDGTIHYLQHTRNRGGTWDGLHWWKDDEEGFRHHLLIHDPQPTLPMEAPCE